ncbi:hypothetical protein ACKVMT_12270 [Halobacteriales archaeon Cl-PHB]
MLSLATVVWRRFLRDLLVVAGWVLVVTLAFFYAGWPAWLYYLAVGLGVVGYSLATAPWLVADDT